MGSDSEQSAFLSVLSKCRSGTEGLAEFASVLTFDDLPVEVVKYVKLLLLDSLGVCIYGSRLPWTAKLFDMVAAERAGEVASVFGWSCKTSPALAALVNASAGHGFELDEIHRDSHLHPGSIVWPVCFAMAEYRGRPVSGKELLTAAVAGYEVGIHVGLAGGHGAFMQGFHPQGVIGTFAAAAAAAKMMKLQGEETLHAMGIAGSQSSGLMAAQEGAMVKRMHAGKAAQSGIYAALLASRGFTGIDNIVDATFGRFLSSYCSLRFPERLLLGLGVEWETLNVFYKPFASAASMHTALDGLRRLMLEAGIVAWEIRRLEIGCSGAMFQHCAWRYVPRGVASAQMNLMFGLASMALKGDVGVGSFTEDALSDPAVLDFIDRIEAFIDPEIEGFGPEGRHAARVIVHTVDGSRYETLQCYRPGTPENPSPPGAIEAKFHGLVSRRFDSATSGRLESLVMNMEASDDISEMLSIVGALAKD